MQKGKFIVVEGLDGAGKTTAVRFISGMFQDLGIPHIVTREPGGTPFAEAIRGVLLDDRLGGTVSKTAHALGMSAARRDHVERIIRPALESGKHVVCDRFFLSTLTHQDGADNLDEIIALGMANTFPDMVIVLDVSYRLARARMLDSGKTLDHFDSTGEDGFIARRKVLMDFAKDPMSNAYVVDATDDQAAVCRQIDEFLQYLKIVPSL